LTTHTIFIHGLLTIPSRRTFLGRLIGFFPRQAVRLISHPPARCLAQKRKSWSASTPFIIVHILGRCACVSRSSELLLFQSCQGKNGRRRCETRAGQFPATSATADMAYRQIAPKLERIERGGNHKSKSLRRLMPSSPANISGRQRGSGKRPVKASRRIRETRPDAGIVHPVGGQKPSRPCAGAECPSGAA